MSDYSELKRLAEAALNDNGDYVALNNYGMAVPPAVVLDLIADVEGLRAQHGRDSAELRSLCQARDDARKERDQLKAKIEALRKDAERYQWLRDPANQEDIEPDSDYLMPPIICGYAEGEDTLDMESLDSAIDAAMTEGEQP